MDAPHENDADKSSGIDPRLQGDDLLGRICAVERELGLRNDRDELATANDTEPERFARVHAEVAARYCWCSIELHDVTLAAGAHRAQTKSTCEGNGDERFNDNLTNWQAAIRGDIWLLHPPPASPVPC